MSGPHEGLQGFLQHAGVSWKEKKLLFDQENRDRELNAVFHDLSKECTNKTGIGTETTQTNVHARDQTSVRDT